MNNALYIKHHADPHADTSLPDPHQDTFSKTYLGFWIYLMTDCILFGAFFATFAVLRNNTFGGPGTLELFSVTTAFIETMILLCSSVTCGLAMLSAVKSNKRYAIFWLVVTFLLGAAFLTLELTEFHELVEEGNSWRRSGFLSSFFALVGLHGFHVSMGMIWMVIMMAQLYWMDITVDTFRRLVLFSLFWHFLDIIWIFIFTFVYLVGVI